MHIQLQDLGRGQMLTLLQWRAGALNHQSIGRRGLIEAPSGGGTVPVRLGPLGRRWARGVDRGESPDVAAAGLDALPSLNSGMLWGMVGGSTGFWIPGVLLAASGLPDIAAVMGVLGAVMSGFGVWVPGYWLRRVCLPPLSPGEAEALYKATQDELGRAYLRLVADVVRQDIAPGTQERVRAALRAVVGAITHLPAPALPRASVDALRAEAVEARAEESAEADAVVAASRGRKADALQRSADAAERSEVLMRRSLALREEMLAQIESLRLGLSGFETGSGDTSGLASLADAVRTVAVESLSVANARMELDDALLIPSPLSPKPPPAEIMQAQRVGE